MLEHLNAMDDMKDLRSYECRALYGMYSSGLWIK